MTHTGIHKHTYKTHANKYTHKNTHTHKTTHKAHTQTHMQKTHTNTHTVMNSICANFKRKTNIGSNAWTLA